LWLQDRHIYFNRLRTAGGIFVYRCRVVTKKERQENQGKNQNVNPQSRQL